MRLFSVPGITEPAPSPRDRRSVSAIGAAPRLSRAQVPGLDPLAASSQPTIRSLIVDIELKAHRAGAEMQHLSLPLNGATVAQGYCFERRFAGMATGVREGVVVLSPSWEPELLPWLCHRLQDFIASDLATLRLVQEGRPRFGAEPSFVANRRVVAMMRSRPVQEVLPLAGSYAEFLDRFGRSTRRNIARGLDAVGRARVTFRCDLGASLPADQSLLRVARRNRPDRQSRARLEKLRDFLADQAQPFHALLTAPDGEWLSAATGFIEGGTAFLVTQSNYRGTRDGILSLTLRALLAERLIAAGITRLTFTGNSAGALLRYCERVRGAELLLSRNNLAARLKQLLALAIQPKSRLSELSLALASFMPAAEENAPPANAETDRFDRLRVELDRIGQS